MSDGSHRLAVLGSPIQHSKSPAIHSAAYRVLGLDWSYEALDVNSGALLPFLESCGPDWRGLSLTMPLKREILPLLAEKDAVSGLVGAVNTVLFDRGARRGFNTDVYGAERMLREALPSGPRTALVLGGGATACSLAMALANLGVQELVVWARDPQRTGSVVAVAERLGVNLSVVGPGIGQSTAEYGSPDVVVSTIPGTAGLPEDFPEWLPASAPLVDVAYDPWPSRVAQHWLERDGTVVNNGLGMLLYQALAQVRIFVGGDPALLLPDEDAVLAAMRAEIAST